MFSSLLRIYTLMKRWVRIQMRTIYTCCNSIYTVNAIINSNRFILRAFISQHFLRGQENLGLNEMIRKVWSCPLTGVQFIRVFLNLLVFLRKAKKIPGPFCPLKMPNKTRTVPIVINLRRQIRSASMIWLSLLADAFCSCSFLSKNEKYGNGKSKPVNILVKSVEDCFTTIQLQNYTTEVILSAAKENVGWGQDTIYFLLNFSWMCIAEQCAGFRILVLGFRISSPISENSVPTCCKRIYKSSSFSREENWI